MTNNSTRPYHQPATQRKRAEVLRNDTFQSRAQAEADEVRGRFAQHEKSEVIGTAASVQYPALPTSSPWHDTVVPPEEPLGFAIDTQEPVGEYGEIQASLANALATASENPADVSAVERGGERPTSPWVSSSPSTNLTGATAGGDAHPSSAGRAEAPKAVGASPTLVEPPVIQSKPRRR
jgi:hypothetical protein